MKKLILILVLLFFPVTCLAGYIDFTLAYGEVAYQDPDTTQDWSIFWGQYKGWWKEEAAPPPAEIPVQIIFISKRSKWNTIQ